MRFHGLVLLAVLSLSHAILAQNGTESTQENFLPPSPRNIDPGKVAPLPLQPGSTMSVNGSFDIEAELKQFRSELREFQVLREEVARSAKSADTDAERVSLQQRQELVELLTKLAKMSANRKVSKPDAPIEDIPEPATIVPHTPPAPALQPSANAPSESKGPDVSVDIADPFALGKVLFRTGDFSGAERAFRKASVAAENEMTLKYLLATCLRRQSRWKDAIEMYKVVANSNKDPVLRDLAKWQLDNIRWLRESESQLEKIRHQREKQQNSANGQSATLGAVNR